MDWILYIFKLNTKHYLVSAKSEDEAWENLRLRLSWRMELVKKRCELVCKMNEFSNIIKI